MNRPTLTLQPPAAATYGRWLTDDWRRIIDLARAADDAGVDRLARFVHSAGPSSAPSQQIHAAGSSWTSLTWPA